MKSLYLLLAICAVSFSSKSQLLRKDIYNFDPGDYIGIDHRAKASYESTERIVRYEMFHILSKTYTSNQDTVTYSAQRQTYIPQLPNGSGGTAPSSYVMDTIVFSHYQLNEFYAIGNSDLVFLNTINFNPFAFEDSTTCWQLDSIYQTPCPQLMNDGFQFGMHIDVIDSCQTIEPPISNYQVYEGVGGPFGGFAVIGDPAAYYEFLDLAFVAKSTGSCGSFSSNFVGITENESINLIFSPNPSSDVVRIFGNREIVTLQIFDLNGKQIHTSFDQSNQSIHVTGLFSGVYTCLLTDQFGQTIYKRFVKQ